MKAVRSALGYWNSGASAATFARASVWSQLSVLVHASLSCAAGAGGLSISPWLSFQLAVHKNPGEQVIRDAFSLANPPSGADMVKLVASAEGMILDMFKSREVSPFDRLPDGSTLLHVSDKLRQGFRVPPNLS